MSTQLEKGVRLALESVCVVSVIGMTWISFPSVWAIGFIWGTLSHSLLNYYVMAGEGETTKK